MDESSSSFLNEIILFIKTHNQGYKKFFPNSKESYFHVIFFKKFGFPVVSLKKNDWHYDRK